MMARQVEDDGGDDDHDCHADDYEGDDGCTITAEFCHYSLFRFVISIKTFLFKCNFAVHKNSHAIVIATIPVTSMIVVVVSLVPARITRPINFIIVAIFRYWQYDCYF